MKGTIRKLRPLEKLAYASGDVSISLSIISASFLIFAFHVQVLGIKPVDAGWILLLVRLIDAISDPLMGILTGRYNTKWGRYRPWLVVAAVPLGLSMFLMFSDIEGSYRLKLIWATGTYIFNTLMFTAVTIPYISLIGVITDDPKERISANVYRFALSKLSTLLVTTMVPYMVVSGENAAQSYSVAFLILGSITVAFLLFCAYKTPEQVRWESRVEPSWKQLKSLFKNDQWRLLSTTMVLVMSGVLTRGTVAIIYATTFLAAGEGKEAAIFMSMWSIGAVVAAYVAKKFTDHYNKIRVFEYSMYATVAIGVIGYFLVPNGFLVGGVILFFLLSLASEMQSPILWAAVAEVADYGRIKTGVDATGLTIGSLAFCQKLGMGISGPVVGYALTFFGYEADAELTSDTLQGISLTMCILPSVFFLLAGLVIRKYIIDNDFYARLIKENVARPPG